MAGFETVQCLCSHCKAEVTRQEMGADSYDRFNKIFEMFQRLDWIYSTKQNAGLGSRIKFVYGEDNYPLYNKVKERVVNELDGFVPRPVFNSLVSAKLSKLNDLRNEYEELRSLYNDAKAYTTTFDTTEVELDDGTTALQCANCGSDEIFILSPNRHLDHLCVTKEDIKDEKIESTLGNGLYLEEGYDFSMDKFLNDEIKREYSDISDYESELRRHKVTEDFYNVASTMTVSQVCRYLGYRANLIADVIADYYECRM